MNFMSGIKPGEVLLNRNQKKRGVPEAEVMATASQGSGVIMNESCPSDGFSNGKAM